MWREILSQLENTVEEKNCELGRLGQRLKMNEEHNARSLSSSEDQLTFIDIFISIIIITNMGININYQVVCNSGQAAHWEQWEAAGKILQLLIIFETFSNIQTWISPADNEVLTSLPITSTLTETSKLYGSRFTWRGECMCWRTNIKQNLQKKLCCRFIWRSECMLLRRRTSWATRFNGWGRASRTSATKRWKCEDDIRQDKIR